MDFPGVQLTQVFGTLLRLILLKCHTKVKMLYNTYFVNSFRLKLRITNPSSKFKYVTATGKKKLIKAAFLHISQPSQFNYTNTDAYSPVPTHLSRSHKIHADCWHSK